MAVTSAGTVTASGPLDVGLGGPLRQLQGDLGLDDRGLALALGVDRRTLTRWMSGENYPQREARQRLQSLVELHIRSSA
jgi:transcriptional regulator with XRE-family HTH domain